MCVRPGAYVSPGRLYYYYYIDLFTYSGPRTHHNPPVRTGVRVCVFELTVVVGRRCHENNDKTTGTCPCRRRPTKPCVHVVCMHYI